MPTTLSAIAPVDTHRPENAGARLAIGADARKDHHLIPGINTGPRVRKTREAVRAGRVVAANLVNQASPLS